MFHTKTSFAHIWSFGANAHVNNKRRGISWLPALHKHSLLIKRPVRKMKWEFNIKNDVTRLVCADSMRVWLLRSSGSCGTEDFDISDVGLSGCVASVSLISYILVCTQPGGRTDGPTTERGRQTAHVVNKMGWTGKLDVFVVARLRA